jgi:hypothetical protein
MASASTVNLRRHALPIGRAPVDRPKTILTADRLGRSLRLAIIPLATVPLAIGCNAGDTGSRRKPPASPPSEVASAPRPTSQPAPTATASPTADPHFSPGWAKLLPDGFVYFNDSLAKLGRAPVEAVVVPAAHGARFYQGQRNKRVTYFTPTLEQVFKINDALLLVTEQTPKVSQQIVGYRYQIVGIDEGAPLLFVNAFCQHHQPATQSGDCHVPFRQDSASGAWVSWPPNTCPPQDWLHKPVLVDDGGACYFNFKYHPKTGAISDLEINGEA